MFKLLLIASVDICGLYLFHSISLVNLDFKLANSLISSSLDKVTTGIYNLQLFIARLAPVGASSLTTGGPASTCLSFKLVIMQFLFHFNSKDTSQLINGIFNYEFLFLYLKAFELTTFLLAKLLLIRLYNNYIMIL